MLTLRVPPQLLKWSRLYRDGSDDEMRVDDGGRKMTINGHSNEIFRKCHQQVKLRLQTQFPMSKSSDSFNLGEMTHETAAKAPPDFLKNQP